MSTTIKKDKIMDFFPEYLRNNDFFKATFLSAVEPLDRLDMIKQRYGYFFFTPYNIDLDDYFPITISCSKKGTTEIDVESKSSPIYEDGQSTPNFTKSKKQVLTVKEQDGSYSISVRFISTLTRLHGIFKYETEQLQTFEKRNYDHEGELVKSTVRTYEPEFKEIDANSTLKWDKDIPYVETTTYYLSKDDAIIEETHSNNTQKQAYYVTLKDGEVVSKQEIAGEAYQECFDRYDDKEYERKANARAKVKSRKLKQQ